MRTHRDPTSVLFLRPGRRAGSACESRALQLKAHVRREVFDDDSRELVDSTPGNTPLEHTAQKQLFELAAQALRNMDDDKREVFALYELEGLTMADVAQSLGIPQGTALSRLYAAREELQQAAELALLVRARRVVLSTPLRTLELTEQHARLYPRGAFAEEREVLAIEALVRADQKAEAAARTRRFRRSFPRSTHGAQLEALLQ